MLITFGHKNKLFKLFIDFFILTFFNKLILVVFLKNDLLNNQIST